MEPIVDSQMTELEKSAESVSERMALEAENAVEGMISIYAAEYKRLADRLIEEDEQKKAAVALKQENTRKTHRQLSTCKKILKNVAYEVHDVSGRTA